MNKKPLNIKAILILGIFCGSIFITINFILGIVIIILSVGLFKSWNAARVATIILSFFFIPLYLYLSAPLYLHMLFMYINHINFGQYIAWATGLIMCFPTFLWCVLSTHFCIKHREYF